MTDEFDIPVARGHTVADAVHNTALSAIVLGKLRAGDALDVRSWATHFGVARSQVRIAFTRMQRQGLTEAAAGPPEAMRSFSSAERRREAMDWALLHGMIAGTLTRDSKEMLGDLWGGSLEVLREPNAEQRHVASFEFYELLRDATPRLALRSAARAAAYRARLALVGPSEGPAEDAALQIALRIALQVDPVLKPDVPFVRWADAQVNPDADESPGRHEFDRGSDPPAADGPAPH